MGVGIAALMLVIKVAAVGLLPIKRDGGVVLSVVGIFSEGSRLAEDELMVVHVVVLLATIVLVGAGVVEDVGRRNLVKNTSLCDRESILLRTFAELTDESRLFSCGRSSPRVVFENKTIAFGGPMLLADLTWISAVKNLHSGNPRVVFVNRILPDFSISCAELSTDMEQSLDGLVWSWLLPKNIIAQTRRTKCLTRWALSCYGPYISDGGTHSVGCELDLIPSVARL